MLVTEKRTRMFGIGTLFAASTVILEEGIALSNGPPLFEDRVFLAISLHRLGRRDEARAHLAGIAVSPDPNPANPWAGLERELLRREVESLVRP